MASPVDHEDHRRARPTAEVAATTLNSVTKIESARLQQPQEDDALEQVIRAAAERRRQAASRPRSGYHDEKGVWHPCAPVIDAKPIKPE